MTKRLDRIRVHDLVARTIIGVNPDERTKRQEVIINLTLWADLRKAGHSDRIADTVNYRRVAKRVVDHVESTDYYLVEALAESIAGLIMTEFPVERVQVGVEKPGALSLARSVGVEIERGREDFT